MESNQDMVEFTLADGLSSEVIGPAGLSDDQKEQFRLSKVGRKKDFCYRERIEGKLINLVEGLELHTNVFMLRSRKRLLLVSLRIRNWVRKINSSLVLIPNQRRGCVGKDVLQSNLAVCYNYAVDKDGNPPA
ncbi:unnamed protein product [Rhodiola kirilowii]